MSAAWTHVGNALPPQGELVEVITSGGDQRDLIYSSGLWWLPDMSMYCYFTPSMWRVLPAPVRGSEAQG